MKIDKSLTAGSTTILILKMLDSKDMYGYQVIEELDRLSENVFTLKAGTLYPLLHNLEKQGMVESYAQLSNSGKPRKYYRITKRGKELFAKKKSEWVAYTAVMNKVLGGYNYAVI